MRAGIVAVHQVHGAALLDADAVDAARPGKADGIVSRDPSKLLTVQTADCAPWLIADRRRGVVAAVHAGWRGTAAGIAGMAVKRMGELFGSRPGDLIAALGPSIGPCSSSMPSVRRNSVLSRSSASISCQVDSPSVMTRLLAVGELLARSACCPHESAKQLPSAASTRN